MLLALIILACFTPSIWKNLVNLIWSDPTSEPLAVTKRILSEAQIGLSQATPRVWPTHSVEDFHGEQNDTCLLIIRDYLARNSGQYEVVATDISDSRPDDRDVDEVVVTISFPDTRKVFLNFYQGQMAGCVVH